MATRCQTAILIHIYHVKAKFSLLQRRNAETLQKALVVFSHLATGSVCLNINNAYRVTVFFFQLSNSIWKDKYRALASRRKLASEISFRFDKGLLWK